MIELTFREGVKLRRSLRSAFRSRSALAQIVFDHLREDLGGLTGDDDYGEVLIKLIVWAEVNGRTGDLIRGARTGNPADDLLSEFEVEYQAQRHRAGEIAGLPPRVLTQALRQALVDAALRIPSSESYEGRSGFLITVPGSLSRNQSNARADLETIFYQLDGLGRLDTGQWPLILVIDNILGYTEGYAGVRDVLNDVRQALEQAYSAC